MSEDESSTRRAWEQAVNRSTSENPERRERFETSSGTEVQRLYTDEDLEGWSAERELGYPGSHPFTRGIQSA